MKLNSSAELTVSCNNPVLLETHMSKLSIQCHCREVKTAFGLVLQLRTQFQKQLKSLAPFSLGKKLQKAQQECNNSRRVSDFEDSLLKKIMNVIFGIWYHHPVPSCGVAVPNFYPHYKSYTQILRNMESQVGLAIHASLSVCCFLGQRSFCPSEELESLGIFIFLAGSK